MIDTLNKIPRRTKLCLRNHLTRRFPALPVPTSVSNSTSLNHKVDGKIINCGDFNESDGEDSHGICKSSQITDKLELRKNLCSHLVTERQRRLAREQSDRWEQDLKVRLKGKVIPPRYWEYPELEKGNLHKHCSYCFDLNCPRVFELKEMNGDIACQVVSCREVRFVFRALICKPF